MRTIVVQKSGVKFDDIAGLETLKRTLDDAVLMPRRFPHLFTGKLKGISIE